MAPTCCGWAGMCGPSSDVLGCVALALLNRREQAREG